MDTNIIIAIIAFVVLFIVYYIKISIDEKRGINSEEKQKIKSIVDEAIPDGESYTAVYATREDFSIQGSRSIITTTTEYYYYAVAFNKPEELYLIPLSVEDGEISYLEPVLYNKENLGKVEIKKGYIKLFDKNNQEIFRLFIAESNTKDDKYNPVNIQQKEEVEAFMEFLKSFTKEINSKA